MTSRSRSIDVAREVGVALDERLDRARDLLLDEPAHAQQQLLQRLQLVLEVAIGVQRHDDLPAISRSGR